MFDHYHRHSHSIYETKTVHEHRAPTDASIKLADEMEKKVLAKILGSVRIDGCEFDCVVHRMADDLLLGINFVISYKVGGIARHLNYHHRCLAETKEEIAKGLIKTLSDDIACVMLNKAVPAGISRLIERG